MIKPANVQTKTMNKKVKQLKTLGYLINNPKKAALIIIMITSPN